jgi:hypothetical protein
VSACTCADWPVQIEKVNGPIMLMTARSGGPYQYDGKPFTHCPWCGSELQDLPQDPPCDHEWKFVRNDDGEYYECRHCDERQPERPEWYERDGRFHD